MYNKMLKPAILSISLLTIMASAAISPALAKIAQAFPDSDETVIKLVLTLPSLMIIPFSLLSGILVKKYGKKKVLIAGLVIYLIGGSAGGFANSIELLLSIRALLGIGIGLIMPLSTALIADFFEAEERTKMMGLSGSVTNLGGVVFLSLSGWLAVMSWRYAFAVYGLAIVSIIMALIWLPEPPAAKGGSAGGTKEKLPGAVYKFAVYGFFLMVFFYVAPTNLAFFIESEKPLFHSEKALFENKEELIKHLNSGSVSEKTYEIFKENGFELSENARVVIDSSGPKRWIIEDAERNFIVEKQQGELVILAERLGRPAIAGNVLSVMTLSGVISGIILSFIMRSMAFYAIPLFILLMGCGFGLLGMAESVTVVFLSVPLIGLSAGILLPNLMLAVPKVVMGPARTLAMAVVSGGVFLGQFMSPIIMKGAGSLLNDTSSRYKFIMVFAAMAFSSIIALILVIKSRKKAV